MANVAELQKTRKGITEKLAAYAGKPTDQWTDEELTAFDSLSSEQAAIDAEIKAAEERNASIAERQKRATAASQSLAAHAPRKADPNPATVDLSASVSADIEGGRFSRLNVELAEMIARQQQSKHCLRASSGPFRTWGEQLQAVAAVATNRDPGGKHWEKLAAVESLAPAGAAAATPTDGGHLIQTDFATDLTGRLFDGGRLLQQVKRIPISANANGLVLNVVDETSRATGSRWGGVQVYWGSEADTATAKKPKFRRMELGLGKLLGLFYATDELLMDAPALEAVAMQAFNEEFIFTLEDAFIRGDGTGKPQGILNAAATVSIAKETGQAAATIVTENIQKMFYAMRPANMPNAKWYINVECMKQLNQMTQVVGVGGVPVFLPPGGLTAAPYGTLMGKEIVPLEYCAALGTVGDIIFADWSQYIMIDKGAMQSASSVHVKFLTDEMTFRFTYRCNGMSAWNSAITPYKGSQTQSPFITLATRS